MWKGSDRQFAQAVKCNSIMHVLMCKVWVLGKQNVTIFNVITFRINGRMITEVYLCISVFLFLLYMAMWCFIYEFSSYTFTMSVVPESHMYVSLCYGFMISGVFLKFVIVSC